MNLMKLSLLGAALLMANLSQAQEINSITLTNNDRFVPLNLKSAIEQGLRQNHDQDLRQFKHSLLTIEEDRNWDSFWLPNLKFEVAVSDQRLKSFFGGSAKDQSFDRPGGVVALGIAEYTLFNWGRDYLPYLNNKTTYQRSKTRLNEERRELRLQIIDQYLDVLTKEKMVKIHQEQLRQATFIFRFNQDKAQLKKISQQEYYQSKSDYLRTQADYHQAKSDLESAERQLGELLNDPIDTRYRFTEQLKMLRIKATLDELLKESEKNNPQILDASTSIQIADRQYDLAKKNSLPLPKISLKVGAYQYQFDDNHSTTKFENELGTDSVEMVATVNATWDVFGSEGFLNTRQRQSAVLKRNQAIKEKEKHIHYAANQIKSLFRQAQHFERMQDILDAEVIALRSAFDVTLDNYTTGKTRFLDLQRALEEKGMREVQAIENKYFHAKSKLLLTKLAGLDDLPGESLENLTEYSANN